MWFSFLVGRVARKVRSALHASIATQSLIIGDNMSSLRCTTCSVLTPAAFPYLLLCYRCVGCIDRELMPP